MLDWHKREETLLAPWAMHAADSAGRVHPEPPHLHRSPYQRDRDRIVHAAAFRRLAHKTQVFTGYHGDYHRSRLTHTLEVTSIARTMARALALNEDLVEALAMGHDIGHPPLGHAGEDTLDALLADEGGFSHNAQALRIMELLENRYPDFPGLNLSREVLGAQMSRCDKANEHGRLLEAQVVDAADSIAYDTHDADDAIPRQRMAAWCYLVVRICCRFGYFEVFFRIKIARLLLSIKLKHYKFYNLGATLQNELKLYLRVCLFPTRNVSPKLQIAQKWYLHPKTRFCGYV